MYACQHARALLCQVAPNDATAPNDAAAACARRRQAQAGTAAEILKQLARVARLRVP